MSHNTNKNYLDEATFKATYIATFLGSYMAGRHEKDCIEGHIGEPYKHQPVEDASFCANCAWDLIQDIF